MNERKRSSSSEEDGSESKRCRQKFTEVESTRILKDDATQKYFDEPLSDECQPQFFNYQLIGDLVAVGILNSKDLIIKPTYYVPVEPITRQRFCDEAWSVPDLLLEMKSKKSSYPIAKKVILSVGYNDYHSNVINPDMFVECLEKTVGKLHRRGCKEIILTNVPPCGMQCDSIEQWKYLQRINEEILKLSEKHDYIGHCDIFKLFCRPKNLFSQNKDYVSRGEINYKVDFTMYNEVGPDGEIDLINFSNLAKIVLGKHVAKTVENRVEYLRRGQVDKVICVLKEASDDSDSEDEAVVIVRTDKADKGAPVINLDSSDEDNANGNRHDAAINKEIPEENVPSRQEISTPLIQTPDDMNEETSCKVSPGEQQVNQGISSSIETVDNVETEKTYEVPPEEERTKQVISSSIESADNVKTEKTTCETPPVSCSLTSVGDMQDAEPSLQILREDERPNQIMSCSVESVGNTQDEKLSCEMPQENEKMKREIIEEVDESERATPEIVQNTEISEPIKQGSVGNDERSEPAKQELVSNTEESELVQRNVVSNIEESEPTTNEIVSSVEKSEPVKQNIVRIIVVSDNIDGEKRSCEIPEKDEPFKRVILCNFKKLEPETGKPSCERQQGVSQSNPFILSCNTKLDIKDEKSSGELPEDVPPNQVILCSFRRVGINEDKPSCEE